MLSSMPLCLGSLSPPYAPEQLEALGGPSRVCSESVWSRVPVHSPLWSPQPLPCAAGGTWHTGDRSPGVSLCPILVCSPFIRGAGWGGGGHGAGTAAPPLHLLLVRDPWGREEPGAGTHGWGPAEEGPGGGGRRAQHPAAGGGRARLCPAAGPRCRQGAAAARAAGAALRCAPPAGARRSLPQPPRHLQPRPPAAPRAPELPPPGPFPCGVWGRCALEMGGGPWSEGTPGWPRTLSAQQGHRGAAGRAKLRWFPLKTAS